MSNVTDIRRNISWNQEMQDAVESIHADLLKQGIDLSINGEPNVSAVIRYALLRWAGTKTKPVQESS